MKKYMFCFLLFAATSLLCLGIGFVITKDSVQPEEAIPGATLETETVTEDQIVINQEKVSPAPEKEKEKYYLVSEAVSYTQLERGSLGNSCKGWVSLRYRGVKGWRDHLYDRASGCSGGFSGG